MALTGSLKEVDIANVIELARQTGAPVRLHIYDGKRRATLYLDGGEIVHARCEDKEGEEAVFALLNWQDGSFEMERGVALPESRNVFTPWNALLLEGLKQLDEASIFSEEEEEKMPEQERLEDVLKEMAASLEPGLNGIAVVGMDGLGIQFYRISGEAAERLSSQVALLMQLARRAVAQMGGGNVQDVQVTTSEGYYLGMPLGDGNFFLVVSVSKESVLGNVRLIMRNFANRIYDAIPGIK